MRYARKEGYFINIEDYDGSSSVFCHSCGRRVKVGWENNIKEFIHSDSSLKRYFFESKRHMDFKEAFIPLQGLTVELPRGLLVSYLSDRKVESSSGVKLNPVTVKINSVFLELNTHNRVPDVILKTDKGNIFVEIVYRNRLSDDKIADITVPCLQLDINDIPKRCSYRKETGEVDILSYMMKYPGRLRWYNDKEINSLCNIIIDKTAVVKNKIRCPLKKSCERCSYNILAIYPEGYRFNSIRDVFCGYEGKLSVEDCMKLGGCV